MEQIDFMDLRKRGERLITPTLVLLKGYSRPQEQGHSAEL